MPHITREKWATHLAGTDYNRDSGEATHFPLWQQRPDPTAAAEAGGKKLEGAHYVRRRAAAVTVVEALEGLVISGMIREGSYHASHESRQSRWSQPVTSLTLLLLRRAFSYLYASPALALSSPVCLHAYLARSACVDVGEIPCTIISIYNTCRCC